MYQCETCGMKTPEGQNPNHDRACWAGQVSELYGIVNLLVNFGGGPGDDVRHKNLAVRAMDKIRAKNDPTYKRVFDPITGARK